MRCRLTNTAKEMWQSLNLKDPEEEGIMELSNVQVVDPDKGPYEKRVRRFFLDAVQSDEVDLEESAYWFTEPEGGWNTQKERYKYAEVTDVEFASAEHFGVGRTSIAELHEGQDLVGTVTDVWLYHGAEIDIGAEYDGLLPILEEEWKDVFEFLHPGTEVRVRIHKLSPPGLYRWPVQLTVIEPQHVQDMIMHPDEFHNPIDMAWAGDHGWGMEEICAATGRTYTHTSYYPERDPQGVADEMQQAFGWDDPDSNTQEDSISRRLDPGTVADVVDLASQLALEDMA